MGEGEETILATPTDVQQRQDTVSTGSFFHFQRIPVLLVRSERQKHRKKPRTLQEANELKFNGNRKQFEMNAHSFAQTMAFNTYSGSRDQK